MVLHVCPRCRYETNRKDDMRRHYNRKRVCKTLFCRKSIKDCLQELENKNRLCISELEKRNKELEDEISRLKNSQSQIINNTNNIKNISNCGNTNNINIQVNAYKDTDYSVIENIIEKCYKKIKDQEKFDLGKCVRQIHCDEENPQNHNIYITDGRQKKLMVYNGNQFEQKGTGVIGIEKFMKDLRKKLKRYFKVDYMIDTVGDYEDSQTKEKEKKEIRDEISNELMNVKELVLQSHKEQDYDEL